MNIKLGFWEILILMLIGFGICGLGPCAEHCSNPHNKITQPMEK